jgi:isoleucyl-tRNA synthetase
MDTGIIVVDGIQLVQGDLVVSRYVELPPSDQATFAAHIDNDVVIILDVPIHRDLVGEGLARELINRVQKLRKKVGLQATDDVDVFYKSENATDADNLKQAMVEYEEMIRRAVRATPKDVAQCSEGTEKIVEEEQEIGVVRFTLTLVKLN